MDCSGSAADRNRAPRGRGKRAAKTGNPAESGRRDRVAAMGQWIVAARQRIVIAPAAAAKIERNNPETRRIAFGELGKVAGVAGQSVEAQDRRPAAVARIIAIVEPKAIGDGEI